MSTKRLLGITALCVVFIAAALSVMFYFTFSGHDDRTVQLPDKTHSPESPLTPESDVLNRVEVTKDTLQAVVSSLSRPDTYSRSMEVEIFWGGGHALYSISVSVTNGITALRILPSVGAEKRIIITPEYLYIWYSGDRTPYVSLFGRADGGFSESDEWQMLVSYEDILRLDKSDILGAGYIEYGGEYCVYGDCRTPQLGYSRRYYIPVSLGLVSCAEEYDESGSLVYSMTAGKCITGEVDQSAFLLPDGTSILDGAQE